MPRPAAVKPTAGQKPSRAAAKRPSAPIAEQIPRPVEWVGKRTIQAASKATAGQRQRHRLEARAGGNGRFVGPRPASGSRTI